MNNELSLFVGILSTIILTMMGFFLKRIIAETDKLFRDHQEKLTSIADSIAHLTREQILIVERLGRLLNLDKKFDDQDKIIVKLLEHEKQHRERYHQLGNYINNIIGILVSKGFDVDAVFNDQKWRE